VGSVVIDVLVGIPQQIDDLQGLDEHVRERLPVGPLALEKRYLVERFPGPDAELEPPRVHVVQGCQSLCEHRWRVPGYRARDECPDGDVGNLVHERPEPGEDLVGVRPVVQPWQEVVADPDALEAALGRVLPDLNARYGVSKTPR
jgi:hypothetical protein